MTGMSLKAHLMRTVAAGVFVAGTLALTAAGHAQETFRIGGLASLTGGAAGNGYAMTEAWKLAVEEINANGGILGKKVELLVADTMTDPTHAASETRRLIENEGVQVVVGPSTSQETFPIATVALERDVPHISSAASTQLTAEKWPNHFSTSVTGADQLKPALELAFSTLGVKKFAVLGDNGANSKAAAVDIAAYLKEKHGLEPVAVQEYQFRTEDMTPQLFALRNAGAEAILFLSSTPDDARKVLENREDIGWDVPVLANGTTVNFAVGIAAIAGAEVFEDVYAAQFAGLTYCPSDQLGSKPFSKFLEVAKAKVANFDKVGVGPLVPFYIQPLILAAAVEGAGSSKATDVTKWLEAHAGEVNLLIGGIVATPASHFLPRDMVAVKNLNVVREDGLYESAECKG